MSSVVLIIYLAAVAGLAYVLFILPQRRRARQAERMLETLKAGDDVVTAGGLFGTVRGFGEGTLMLEVAPNTEVKVATRAIVQILSNGEPRAAEAAPETDEAEAE